MSSRRESSRRASFADMSLRYRKKAFAGRVDDRDTTVASIFAALANLKRPAITLCAVVVVANEFARLSITILGTYRLPRAGLRTLVNALLGSSVGLNALVVLTSLVVQLLKMEPRQRPILRRSTFGLAYFEKRVTVVVLRASGFDHQLDAIVATLCGAAQAFNLNDFFEECGGDSTPHECVVAYVEGTRTVAWSVLAILWLAHASGVYHDPPLIDRRKLFCAECCATGDEDETWPKPEESGTSATPIRRSRLSERSPQIEALQRRSTARLHGTATRSPPRSPPLSPSMRSAMGETSLLPQQQPSLRDKIFVIGLQLSSSSIFTFVYLLLWVVGIGFTIYSLEMRVDLVDAMLANHTSRVGDDAGASQAEIAELYSHTSYWHQFTLTFVLGIDTTLLVLSVVRATPLFSPDLRYWPRNLVLSLALNVGTFAATLAYRVTVGYTSSTGLLGWRVSDWASLAYLALQLTRTALLTTDVVGSWVREHRGGVAQDSSGRESEITAEESLDEGTAADVAAAAAAATAAAAEAAEARREAERSRRASEEEELAERTTIAHRAAAAAARAAEEERPLRILCMDGGGIKGLNLAELVRAIEERTGQACSASFDLICGTSVGGAAALMIGTSAEPLQGPRLGRRQLGLAAEKIMAKLSLLHYLKKGVFASSVHFDRFLSDHYFPSIGLSAEEPLPPANPTAGSDRVPHMFVTATKLANDVHVPFNEFLVCNYPRPWDAEGERGSSDWPAADAVKATAAASPYFPPVVRDGETFVDGGFSISNPTLIAVHEAERIWPGRPIGLVVSLGCGRAVQSAAAAQQGHGLKVSNIVKKMVNTVLSSERTHRAAAAYLKAQHHTAQYFRVNPTVRHLCSMTESKWRRLAPMLEEVRAYLDDHTTLLDAIARAISPNWRLRKLQRAAAEQTANAPRRPSVQPVVEAPPPPNAASANGETNAMLKAMATFDRSDTSKDAPWISKPKGRADTYVAVVMLLALLPKLLVFYLPLILLLLPSALANYLYLFARADPRTPFPRGGAAWPAHIALQLVLALPVAAVVLCSLAYDFVLIVVFGLLYTTVTCSWCRLGRNLGKMGPFMGGPLLFPLRFADCVVAAAGQTWRFGVVGFSRRTALGFLACPWVKYWQNGNPFVAALRWRFITQIGRALDDVELDDIHGAFASVISDARHTPMDTHELEKLFFAPHYPQPAAGTRVAIGMQLATKLGLFVHTTHFDAAADAPPPFCFSTSRARPVYRVMLWGNNPFHIFTGYVEANVSDGQPSQPDKLHGLEHPMWLLCGDNYLASSDTVLFNATWIDRFFDHAIPLIQRLIRGRLKGWAAANSAYLADPRQGFETESRNRDDVFAAPDDPTDDLGGYAPPKAAYERITRLPLDKQGSSEDAGRRGTLEATLGKITPRLKGVRAMSSTSKSSKSSKSSRGPTHVELSASSDSTKMVTDGSPVILRPPPADEPAADEPAADAPAAADDLSAPEVSTLGPLPSTSTSTSTQKPELSTKPSYTERRCSGSI